MYSLWVLTLVILGILLPTSVFAQAGSAMQVAKLTDQIYKLTADRGGYVVNMVALIGDDGILLVDTGEKDTAEELKAAIDTLGDGGPQIIINTHAHVDHTGGNAIFGKEPLIIGHRILRTRLRSGSYLFDEFPDETLPDITFTDSLSLHFNGEEIRIIAFPGSHDDNDAIVWFTESKIVYVGDIINGVNFPSVEEVTGNVLNFPAVAWRVRDILPDDVTIVSGHGEDCTRDDLLTFSEGINKTIDIVRKELAKGKDRAALQEEDVLKGWESFAEGYVSKDEWLSLVVEALQDTIHKKTIYEPIYYTLRKKGAAAAIEHYYELKKDHYDEYRFTENDLAFMAGKLSKKNRFPEAIKFFELCIEEYPAGLYGWYYYYNLGKLFTETGDKEQAIKSYQKSLELNPDNSWAADKLEQLEKK